jgi:hypothetical protein
MPDIALPVSPLAHVLTPGRYGRALPEGPGVTLSSVHPCEIVSVIAAKGKARALAMAMKKDFGVALPGMGESTSARGLTLVGVQPDGWLALQPGGTNLAGRLEDKAGKHCHGHLAIAWANGDTDCRSPRARRAVQGHGRGPASGSVQAGNGGSHPDRACGRDHCARVPTALT